MPTITDVLKAVVLTVTLHLIAADFVSCATDPSCDMLKVIGFWFCVGLAVLCAYVYVTRNTGD